MPKGKENIIVKANLPAGYIADNEPLVEECGSRPWLAVPLQSASAHSSDTFSAASTHLVVDENERRMSSE